jgi:hypothetical protein
MKRIFKKLLIGASIAAGVSALASTPASAGSLTNATIGGSANTDYYVYDVQGNKTVKVPNSLENVQKVLDGNAASPTGNVELRASSEKAGFDFTKNTTLTGKIGAETLTLSSLTSDDWFGAGNTTTTYGATNLANTWFNKALQSNGITDVFLGSVGFTKANLFTAFLVGGGFQRFSDPNVSYVNQDESTGLIRIGLAGHYDATNLLLGQMTPQQQQKLALARMFGVLPAQFQASEVVKYTYNGVTDYLYNFKATNSGLVAADDGRSHTGNYEVDFQGKLPVQSTPEPSVILGMLMVGGMFATQRRLKKA